MPFPFADYRAQQKKFAAEVYRAARDGAQLLVEAPTGSGKTLSALFPALKALGEGQCDQVIYLTAKVSGQQQALATLELLAADASWAAERSPTASSPFSGKTATPRLAVTLTLLSGSEYGSRTASSTFGWRWPVLSTAMPPAKST